MLSWIVQEIFHCFLKLNFDLQVDLKRKVVDEKWPCVWIPWPHFPICYIKKIFNDFQKFDRCPSSWPWEKGHRKKGIPHMDSLYLLSFMPVIHPEPLVWLVKEIFNDFHKFNIDLQVHLERKVVEENWYHRKNPRPNFLYVYKTSILWYLKKYSAFCAFLKSVFFSKSKDMGINYKHEPIIMSNTKEIGLVVSEIWMEHKLLSLSVSPIHSDLLTQAGKPKSDPYTQWPPHTKCWT